MNREKQRVQRGRPVASSFACLLVLACSDVSPVVARIEPGPNVQERLQRALIEARGGGDISLGAGRFEFDAPIIVDASKLILRGQGMGETVLDFSAVTTGSGDGLIVTGDDFVLEDLAIQRTPGDAVRLQKARRLTVRRVRIDWPGEPGPRNGGYGIYPVECEDLVIENNQIRGAADSGIYVGISARGIVRRNEVWESVAGIQIENATDIAVLENDLHDNAAGILAFSLPEIEGATERVKIENNRIESNNGPNFARPGSRVSEIPSGSGLIVMAADQVEVAGNRFAENETTHLSIYSFAVLQQGHSRFRYDPFPEGIWIHGNRFRGGGDAPKGRLARALREHVGLPFPDIVFDGARNPELLEADSAPPPEKRIYLADNGGASFVDLDLERFFRGEEPRMTRDASSFAGRPSAFPQPAAPERRSAP